MADFVPIHQARAFNAGLLGGSSDRKPTESRMDPSSGAADEHVADPGSALPSTAEELEALLDAARVEAREAATAILSEEHAKAIAMQETLGRLADDVDEGRARWAAEVRNLLGELVVAGVRQVVGDSVELQQAMLRDRFAEIGERLIGESEVMIRVRPQDVVAANEMIGGRDGWSVVSDSDISGGVIAETDSGRVDATVGAAIAGLAEAVQGWQAEGPGEDT